MSDFARNVTLWKADAGEFQGKVWGVVLEPDLPDSQHDEITAEEIERACHAYLRDALAPDVQHSGRDADADLLENYIAPCDFTMETPAGPKQVRRGSWIQVYWINDLEVRDRVRTGELTGLSIEGSGVRVPVPA